jgi:hypothetical protein
VLAERAERLGHQAAQRGDGLAARDLAVGLDEVAEIAGEQLVEDGLLRVEVVVETAGQHTGRVPDVPDRGGAVATVGEQFRRDPHQVGTPLGGLAPRFRHVLSPTPKR